MSAPDTSPKISSNDGKLKKIGFWGTCFWLGAVAGYTIVARSEVAAMGPHDLADSLGGVFAPLAFLWLVLGYLQQGEELRHSVEALRLQGVELSHSVEQQRQLVEATREQIAQEREMLAAEEAAAARAAAPMLRIRLSSTGGRGDVELRNYSIDNFGKECRNVHLTVTPLGIKQRYGSLHNHNALEFRVELGKGETPTEQHVIVDYIDQRNISGSKRFTLPVETDANGQLYYGEPFAVD
jgi:hypothetical protein